MTHAPSLLLSLLFGAAPATHLPVEAAVSPQRIRQAVDGALAYLTEDGLKWMRERQCASCHHAPEMLWTLHEARNHGYAVNEPALAGMSAWALAADNSAKSINAAGAMGGDKVSLQAIYLALGASAAKDADAAAREGVARLAAHIVSMQSADGSWSGPSPGRAPLFDNPEIITLLGLWAISSPLLSDAPDQPALAAAREKAQHWLAGAAMGPELNSLLWRLMTAVRLGQPAESTRPLIDRLLASQRADGGWAQTDSLPSDPLATGQALYVLRSAGIDSRDAAIQRGIAYLVDSQSADGGWTMHSRPATPDGPPGKTIAGSPISYTGTAWAAIGLIRCGGPRDD
jgi:hypothetical protein